MGYYFWYVGLRGEEYVWELLIIEASRRNYLIFKEDIMIDDEIGYFMLSSFDDDQSMIF
jgi:hypothetical protein